MCGELLPGDVVYIRQAGTCADEAGGCVCAPSGQAPPLSRLRLSAFGISVARDGRSHDEARPRAARRRRLTIPSAGRYYLQDIHTRDQRRRDSGDGPIEAGAVELAHACEGVVRVRTCFSSSPTACMTVQRMREYVRMTQSLPSLTTSLFSSTCTHGRPRSPPASTHAKGVAAWLQLLPCHKKRKKQRRSECLVVTAVALTCQAGTAA